MKNEVHHATLSLVFSNVIAEVQLSQRVRRVLTPTTGAGDLVVDLARSILFVIVVLLFDLLVCSVCLCLPIATALRLEGVVQGPSAMAIGLDDSHVWTNDPIHESGIVVASKRNLRFVAACGFLEMLGHVLHALVPSCQAGRLEVATGHWAFHVVGERAS